MTDIGFIGLGGMGMHQVRSFVKTRRCRVVAGCDLADQARERFAGEFPRAAVYADHRQLLADGNVEAVLIATPTLFHKQTAIDALRSGRDVLTEKPMARTVADARRMNAVAKETGKLLMVAQCRRFDTDWGTLGKMLQSGRIGGPVLWRHAMAACGLEGTWFTDDKLGGGPLMDGAVHNQDFANLIFGDPVSVISSSIKISDDTAVNTATAVVRYTSGSQLMLSWSWGAAPAGNLFDILGPKGSILSGPGPDAGKDLDLKKYGYYHVVNKHAGKVKVVRFTRKDMYVSQAKHFLDCIAGKTECLSPGTEAIKAVASAEAILKAGPKGTARKVVW